MADAETTEVSGEEPANPTPAADETLLAGDGEQPKGEDTLLSGDDPKGDDPKEPKTPDGDEPSGAPEEYAEFEMPEGAELDETLLSKFTPLAKELNLTQEQAQKLVNLQSEFVADQQAAIAKEHADQRAAWRDEIKALPDHGKVLADAKKAISAFATDDETKTLLTQTWLGDNPHVIQFLAKVGKVIGEDGFPGASGDQPKAADARALYPSMPNP